MDTIFISDDGVKDDTFIKVAQNTLKVSTPPAPKTFPAKTHGQAAKGPQTKPTNADPGAFF
jgi:branched-chain amino acid transport system substrate-binding protein